MIAAAHVICSVLAVVAALCFAMFAKSVQSPSHGNFYEFYVIAAAVLGRFPLNFAGIGAVILLGVLADLRFAAYRAKKNAPHRRWSACRAREVGR